MPETKPNIIVVDDDPGMSRALQRLLTAAGFRATTFDSAEALMECGTPIAAACFILDIHLPGLSGFGLRCRLRESGVESPVIFITAYGEASFKAQAEQAGAAGFFTKPFLGKRLLAAINQALRPASR